MDIKRQVLNNMTNIQRSNYMASNNGMTDPLLISAANGQTSNIENILTNTNVSRSRLDRALVLAAKAGYLTTIQYLLLNGATSYNDAFLAAAKAGQTEIVSYFIEAANTDATGPSGLDFNAAVLISAREGQTDTLNYLLNEGVRITGKPIPDYVYLNALV